jgi:KUP system potassium uptake protein
LTGARRGNVGLGLAALGIVYGDLGTSPLYTMQTIVQAAGGRVTPADGLGSLSLLFWTLLITVSIKYCVFVMRADNHGEGGILALMALIGLNRAKGKVVLVSAGLFGAALIYGDGVITPAISVLSALEGVNVATDAECREASPRRSKAPRPPSSAVPSCALHALPSRVAPTA